MSILFTTGRSGSTFVTRLLARHPDVVALSEALIALEPAALPTTVSTLEGALTVLERPRPQLRAQWRLRLFTPEMTCDLDGPPPAPMLVCALPAISHSPLHLNRMTIEHGISLLPQPTGALLARCFDYITEHQNGSTWIERSGGSLLYFRELRCAFEDQPFGVLLRDPVRTVFSMSRHTAFQFAAMRWRLQDELGFDPYRVDYDNHNAGQIPAALAPLLPETLTLEAFRNAVPGAEWFAFLWSEMIRRMVAVEPLSNVPILVFEDLLVRPEAELPRLAAALGISRESSWERWAKRAILDSEERPETSIRPEEHRLRSPRVLRRALDSGLEILSEHLGGLPTEWEASLNRLERTR